MARFGELYSGGQVQLNRSLVQVQDPKSAETAALSPGTINSSMICRAASGYSFASSGIVFIIFSAFLVGCELVRGGLKKLVAKTFQLRSLLSVAGCSLKG